jgi:hypothetical protein
LLRNGLWPVIRTGVLRENKTIISRAQVLAAAQRQEELLSEAGERGAGKTSVRGASVTSTGSVRDALRSESAGRTPVTDASVAPAGSVRDALRSEPKARKCYECGKEGHLARKCPRKESITAIWESVDMS